MTTVSAVIPTFQRNDLLLNRSLASVLRQTRPVDEIIIVADGMTEPLIGELGAGLAALNDERITLWNIERPDYPTDPGDMWSVQGWAARNFGLDKATGEWIASLDDDDEWTNDHVEVLLAAALDKGVDFAYGKAVTPWGQWYGTWPPTAMNFTDGSQIYKRSLGYRYDPESISRDLPTDADLWIRMINGGVTFTFVDRTVHRYHPAER